MKTSPADAARNLAQYLDRYIRIACLKPDNYGVIVFVLPIGVVMDYMNGKRLTKAIRKYLAKYGYTIKTYRRHYYEITKRTLV